MDNKVKKIEELKKELNAVILVHNYQPAEIQDIADYSGDSLGLSEEAASTDADVIIFCGVDFMAETAKILSPDKTVILPVKEATCPMANMITAADLRKFKAEYPEAIVISYVNTTAEVKAESDICCTSANAVKVTSSVGENEVIFTPDKNLANYVSKHVNKRIIPWQGYCPVHDSITVEDIKKARELYPDAVFMAHPECRPEVLKFADHVVSTGGMFTVVEKDDSKSFIVGTEEGIIYPLKKKYPDKEFIPVRPGIVCVNMKKMTLDRVIESMEELSPEIEVPENIIEKASHALNRMLDISR
ncbi:quinolinate synthase NadA [Elusimicrobiota bacterium]